MGGADREGVISVATELAIRCGGLHACLGRGRHTGTEGEGEQGEEKQGGGGCDTPCTVVVMGGERRPICGGEGSNE